MSFFTCPFHPSIQGKKLILRPRLFELVAGPQILSVVDEKEDVLDVVKIFGGRGALNPTGFRVFEFLDLL